MSQLEQIEADVRHVFSLQYNYRLIDVTMPLDEYTKKVFKDLKRLITSNDLKEKETLNSIVKKVIAEDDIDAYKHLIELGFKISACNDKGATVIHVAFNNGYKMLKQDKGHLLFSSTDDCNYSDSCGLSHLHIACALGNTVAAKKYLNSSASINAQCNPGSEYLLDYDYSGFTPLHCAVANLRYDVVKLLLEYGANVEAKDAYGRTSLHLACARIFEYEYPSSWEDELDIIDILIKYGSDINTKCNSGCPAVIEIFTDVFLTNEAVLSKDEFDVESGVFINKYIEIDNLLRQKEKLELLVGYGVDVSVSSTNGTLLHYILIHLETIRFPLCYADVSFDDTMYLEMIQLILANTNQIDVSLVSEKWESPMSLAVSYMSLNIVEIFMNHTNDWSSIKLVLRTGYNSQFHSLPTLECARNLTSIIKLLLDKEYNLTLECNFTILKFLIHGIEECNCYTFIFPAELGHAVNFFSPHHISCLNRIADRVISFQSIVDLEINLKSIEYAKLYIDEDIKKEVQKVLQKFDISFTGTLHYDYMKKEIEQMKSIKLRNDVNLYDVMTKHPHDIYKYIQFSLFDKKIIDDFEYYKPIIRGHFAKSIIRHYVVTSAHNYLQFSLFSLLPYVCCNRILYYLNNKDIWYLCSAFFTDNLDDSDNKFTTNCEH